MERYEAVKNNQAKRYSPVFKNHSFKTELKKVGLEHHYVVPWEQVSTENSKVDLKQKF